MLWRRIAGAFACLLFNPCIAFSHLAEYFKNPFSVTVTEENKLFILAFSFCLRQSGFLSVSYCSCFP